MPTIPENPPALSKEQLKKESADPLPKLKKNDAKDNKLGLLQILQKVTKLKTMETVNVKQLAKHELSVKQQLYYKEITEACVGSDNSRRAEALQSLVCTICCPGCAHSSPRGSGSTWSSTIWQSFFT
jgi:transcription initiation factor TFIID subunit 6